MQKKNAKTPPWKTKNPNKGKPQKLTAEEKEIARARAAENNRRYPNLVDNMWVLKQRTKP